MAKPIQMPFGLWIRMGPRSPMQRGKEHAHAWAMTFCHQLYKNGWTDRFAVWVVNSGGPKEAKVKSYLTGCANVPSWGEGTLVPAGEYDWIVRLQWWCGLMSNYFDHLSWLLLFCLQCFDTVGCWASGRAISILKNWVMRCWHGYVYAVRCEWFAYCPADATATPSSLASLKSR